MRGPFEGFMPLACEIAGAKYAKVFPVPVSDWRKISFLVSILGMARRWTFVGALKPRAPKASANPSWRPSVENSFMALYLHAEGALLK
jgi:hypothetical protein